MRHRLSLYIFSFLTFFLLFLRFECQNGAQHFFFKLSSHHIQIPSVGLNTLKMYYKRKKRRGGAFISDKEMHKERGSRFQRLFWLSAGRPRVYICERSNGYHFVLIVPKQNISTSSETRPELRILCLFFVSFLERKRKRN